MGDDQDHVVLGVQQSLQRRSGNGTLGLVTLPGAFVGMLLAGASPVQAGAVQVFVLVALLAVEALSVALTVELVGRAGACRGVTGAPGHAPTAPLAQPPLLRRNDR